MNLVYDAALSFGARTIANGNFPELMNLGKADGSADHYPGKDFTGVDRLTVDVCCKDPSGGSSITVTVYGGEDENNLGETLGLGVFLLADMKAGPCRVAIRPGKWKMLRVSLAVTGTFSGSAEAFLNTYAGK